MMGEGTATGLLAALLALVAGCASGTWNQTARFPAEGGDWQVPLHRPLTSDGARIWTVLDSGPAEGRPRRTVETVFVVDSGATWSSVPEHVLGKLGVALVERDRVRVVDASGRERSWRGGLVRAIRMGELTLADAPFYATHNAALLGLDVLGQRAWEVDFDRGVMVLGAPPWSDTEHATSIDLSSRWRSSHLQVMVDSHPVLLALDTGADYTSLDMATGRELDLRTLRLGEPVRMHSVHGSQSINAVFHVSELTVGDRHLGPQPLFPLRDMQFGGALNQKVVGLLGMDVLKRFRFRVESDTRLQLQARRSLAVTADARLARWDWVPECEGVPGCASAHTHEAEDHSAVTLHVEIEGQYTRSAAFLFGCVTAEGVLDDELPWMEAILSSPEPGAEARFEVPRGDDDPLAARWAQVAHDRCASFALLDVNPEPERPPDARDGLRILRNRVHPIYPEMRASP